MTWNPSESLAIYNQFSRYSREVLAYRLGAKHVPPTSANAYAELDKPLNRLLRLCSIKKPQTLFLYGLGDGTLARRLASELAPDVGLVVLETDTELCRERLETGNLEWWQPESGRVLLADSSPWALAALLASFGLMPATSIVAKQPSGITETLERSYRLFTTMLGPFVPSEAPNDHGPSLSLASIIHPDDEDLPGFVAALPRLARELVIVWDAESPPDTGTLFDGLPYPVVQAARRLQGDFAAQRNQALSLCRGDWVFFIDADERLIDHQREAVGRLAASGLAEWFALPRLTLFPDPEHAKIGYGLWPDIQARLFARKPGVHFEGQVHEKLAGASGNLGLALDCPLLHHSHLLKDEAAWARKLSVFDSGLFGETRHHLSKHYPHLPVSFFLPAPELPATHRLFLVQSVGS